MEQLDIKETRDECMLERARSSGFEVYPSTRFSL